MVACVAMVVGYIAFDPADRKRAHHSLFFLLFCDRADDNDGALEDESRNTGRPFAVIFCCFRTPAVAGRSSFDVDSTVDATCSMSCNRFWIDQAPRAATKDAELRELWRTIGVAVVAVVLAVASVFQYPRHHERHCRERSGHAFTDQAPSGCTRTCLQTK